MAVKTPVEEIYATKPFPAGPLKIEDVKNLTYGELRLLPKGGGKEATYATPFAKGAPALNVRIGTLEGMMFDAIKDRKEEQDQTAAAQDEGTEQKKSTLAKRTQRNFTCRIDADADRTEEPGTFNAQARTLQLSEIHRDIALWYAARETGGDETHMLHRPNVQSFVFQIPKTTVDPKTNQRVKVTEEVDGRKVVVKQPPTARFVMDEEKLPCHDIVPWIPAGRIREVDGTIEQDLTNPLNVMINGTIHKLVPVRSLKWFHTKVGIVDDDLEDPLHDLEKNLHKARLTTVVRDADGNPVFDAVNPEWALIRYCQLEDVPTGRRVFGHLTAAAQQMTVDRNTIFVKDRAPDVVFYIPPQTGGDQQFARSETLKGASFLPSLGDLKRQKRPRDEAPKEEPNVQASAAAEADAEALAALSEDGESAHVEEPTPKREFKSGAEIAEALNEEDVDENGFM